MSRIQERETDAPTLFPCLPDGAARCRASYCVGLHAWLPRETSSAARTADLVSRDSGDSGWLSSPVEGARPSGDHLRPSHARTEQARYQHPFTSDVAVVVPSDFLAPPTRRVVRRRPTWPSASRTDPGTAWSAQAKWDHQRTMYVDTSPARSLSRHELLQPSSRRRLRHGGPRMDWTTPEVWTDAQLDAL